MARSSAPKRNRITKARGLRAAELDPGDASEQQERVVELVPPTPGGKADGTSPSASHSETPDYLVPKMGQYPLSDSAFYTTVVLTDVDLPGGKTAGEPLKGPLDPLELDLNPKHATAPARGVILTHEQSWHSRGLALGNLLHSLCLAPGEVTKVAMVDWHRQTAASSSESVDESDQLSQSSSQNRAVSEVQHAVAREMQRGGSSSTSQSLSSQGGVGWFMGSASSAAGATTASAVQFSTGVRDISSSANQRIEQRTEEFAQAVRSRRATIVQEVSERESERLTTRVVANYNHMHALTMQYYEVLEVYAIETKVVDAERCLFLPMQVVDFGDAKIVERYREVLAEAAAAAGMPEVREALIAVPAVGSDKQSPAEQARAAANQLRVELDKANEVLAREKQELAAAQRDVAQARSTIQQAQQNPFKFITVAAQMMAHLNEAQAKLNQATGEHAAAKSKADALQAKWKAADDAAVVAEKAAKLTAARLTNLLNRHRLYFNQRIWLSLDPFTVTQLFADKSYDGESLAGALDPSPVAVFGNYVGFRWQFPAEKAEAARKFRALYVDERESRRSTTVSIPTGGVFAEAVLGQSNCAEKVDLTRYWKWQDSPIPILPSEIQPLAAGSRARGVDTSIDGLSAPAVQLRGGEALPPPSGLSAIAQAVATSNLFRDMSGGEAVSALAKAALEASSSGAKDAAARANENLKEYMGLLKELAPLAEAYLTGGASTGATMVGGMMNAAVKSGPSD